ncbi:MAG: selenocysteine-specific translation elongation factor [Bryobacteraceae bacterium]|nr:selenocysteine-specific translation elongation factor [Bryobacteraceae bacterium]
MRNIIVGTAGHIDHGKTALVRALTGIETDRLEEERRRGISIDLGFAHMEAGAVRFGFVDVPGHERFVRNMLAGAGGIDMVVLVIGADESIKPQTREHFDICRLLGVRHGLIALTKSDLVDPDIVELVRLEAAEFVEGSFLEGAPVIAVSSKTGEGLDGLRSEMTNVAARVEPRKVEGGFRLPIDRSFVLKGFGTVVTGTLWSGRLRVEDEVEVYPSGRRLRVRGLHVHGGAVEVAEAGQRVAVNLAGVEAEELGRGMTLAPVGWFSSTTVVDSRFDLLGSAHPMKHRAPVHFHAGTSETEAEVRLLDGREAMEPGTTGHLRLMLKEPLLLLPGDRFIARMFSPVVTIGGGEILDNRPPLRLRKPAALARLLRLSNMDLGGRLAAFVDEAAGGIEVPQIVARTGLSEAEVRRVAKQAGLVQIPATPPVLISKARLEVDQTNFRQALSVYHQQHPLEIGMPKVAAPVQGPLLDYILSTTNDISIEGDLVRLVDFRPQLKADEDEAKTKIESLFREAGLAVPAVNEVLKGSGIDANRARTILQTLLRQKTLIRVSMDLIFHAEAIEQLKSVLSAKKGQRFGVPEFKDWTGISRKYAIPLLEFMDRERVTRREGDQRLVL